MSTEPDFPWSLNNGDPDANQQDVSPESFERHIEDSEMELDWPLHQFQDHFTYLRETLPVTTTPSSLTYSTMSESELAASQRSQHLYAFAPSEYSIHSEIATRGPEEHGIYIARDYMSSTIVPNDPSSFGPLPPSPPSHLVRAHPDYRTSDPYHSFYDISPEEPSLDMQQSSTTISSALHPNPVQGMSDGQTQVAPAREYQCHLCSHSSKRKSNLKVHILTHDKEKSKRFECPTCGNRFTRKHDLKRHRRDQHGDLGSPSSDSGSAVASGSATSVPEANLACFWQV